MEHVATILRGDNWEVAPGPVVEPGGAFNSAIYWRVDQAACVVVGWSANSVDLARVGREAAHAFAAKKLVAVRLDHASHPLADAPVVDMTAWDGLADELFVSHLLTLIGAAASMRAPLPTTSRAAAIQAADATSWQKLVMGMAILIAVAAAVIAVELFFRPHNGQAALLANRADPAAPLSAAEAKWQAVSKTDPGALRKFEMEQFESPFVGEARQTLNRLEAAAWGGAVDQADAIARQRALNAYTAAFQEPGDQQKAVREADRARRIIAETQGILRTLGYPIADPEGLGLSSTVAAVRAFEVRANLPVTGSIDDKLIGVLNTAAPPEVVRNIRQHVQGIIFWTASPTGNSLVGQALPQ